MATYGVVIPVKSFEIEGVKKIVVILILVAALTLLGIRLFTNHAEGIEDERMWYVKELHYNFSATIDSIATFPRGTSGLVYFRITGGNPELSRESMLEDQLEYNGDLDFILDKPNHTLAFHTLVADKYKVGDSLVINTDRNRITVFRNHKYVTENDIAASLSGRPF